MLFLGFARHSFFIDKLTLLLIYTMYMLLIDTTNRLLSILLFVS